MASTDWDNPVLASTHVNILNELKARDVDAIKMIDDETPSNLPEKAKKWDDTLKVFRSWIEAAWTTLILAVAGGGTGSATAGGARTNLDVDSKAEVDGKIATHQAIANAHGAVSIATANKIIVRDAAGSAKVVAPSEEDDIALKGNVTTVQGNLNTHAALTSTAHGGLGLPVGTKMLFYQDTAPTGWTILNTLDDKLVYITKGSVAGGQTGGAVHPTGTWVLSGINTGAHALTVAEIPAHHHITSYEPNSTPYGGAHGSPIGGSTYNTGDTGGGEAHSHPMAANDSWRPAAYCCIICQKS
jgi:hypothetical protein